MTTRRTTAHLGPAERFTVAGRAVRVIQEDRPGSGFADDAWVSCYAGEPRTRNYLGSFRPSAIPELMNAIGTRPWLRRSATAQEGRPAMTTPTSPAPAATAPGPLYVNDNGEIACVLHGGAYLAFAVQTCPRTRVHHTPLGTWQRLTADALAFYVAEFAAAGLPAPACAGCAPAAGFDYAERAEIAAEEAAEEEAEEEAPEETPCPVCGIDWWAQSGSISDLEAKHRAHHAALAAPQEETPAAPAPSAPKSTRREIHCDDCGHPVNDRRAATCTGKGHVVSVVDLTVTTFNSVRALPFTAAPAAYRGHTPAPAPYVCG
jgi:hypothetical protein